MEPIRLILALTKALFVRVCDLSGASGFVLVCASRRVPVLFGTRPGGCSASVFSFLFCKHVLMIRPTITPKMKLSGMPRLVPSLG